MNPKILPLLGLSLAAALSAHADPVTGWVRTNGDLGFTGGSEATSSPVTDNADGDTIAAGFPGITLAEGDSIVLTGQWNITGATGTISGNQMRFGLFQSPAPPATNEGSGYVGVWGSAPSGGVLVTADGSTTNPFSGTATTTIANASSVGGLPQFGTTYTLAFTVTRVSATEIEVGGSFTDNAGFTATWPATVTAPSPADFTYNAVGILIGGTVNATTGTFTDIDVTYVRNDSDNDGMRDAWELTNGLVVGIDDSAENPDDDGLTNIQEYLGDDGTPFTGDETNPQVADTDGDGIDDGPELTLGTDPLDTDSDGDYFADGYEVTAGTDPTLDTSFPVPTDGLFIDFSAVTGNGQLGTFHDPAYSPFVADHEIDEFNALPDQLAVDRSESYPVPAFPGSPTVTLSVAYPDLISGDPRAKQLIGRTDAFGGGGYATTYEGEHPDLMRDWIGIDSRAASGGNGPGVDTSMTFTLDGLPAGTYQYRGYHHDVANMQARFGLSVEVAGGGAVSLGTFRITHGTANGLSPLTQPGSGNPPSVLPSAIEFLFTVPNDNDPVVITYSVQEQDSLFNSFVAVNAIEVTTAVDTDGDGIPDEADLRPNDDDTGLSSDADSLTDLQEFHLGTKPDDPDTDGDGFNDDAETHTGTWAGLTDTGTSPFHADWDDDGLMDGLETNDLDFSGWPAAAGTNPFVADTDLDGYDDGEEAYGGYDPTDDTSFPPPPPFLARIVAVDLGAATPTAIIEWNSIPGATYDIYASDSVAGDPLDLTDWTEVEVFYPATGTTTTLTEELPSPVPAKRFYRIYEYPPL